MPSKLIKDLTHVPNIIGELGLSIAEAQRHFDLNYLEGLERCLVMAQSLLGGKKAGPNDTAVDVTDAEKEEIEKFRAFVTELLMAVAPSRYQFTQTTLSVKLDLAQSFDFAGSLGVSAGMGAVAVNASMSAGYSSDYRAAAECTTVLHAIPPDRATLRALLDRAKEIHDKDMTLPAGRPVDRAVQEQAARVFEKLTGVKPPAVKEG